MAGASIPQVTVVVPTRNRPEFAARAVHSARGQRDVGVEVVVVDDGSEPALDGSTLEATIVRHDRSRGVAVARNSGLSRASAPLVAFLDDDDLWAPTKLAAQVAAIDARDAGFAYGAAVVTDIALRPLQSLPAPEPSALLAALLRRNALPAGASNVLVRTSLLREIGGFDPAFVHLDDWDCWIRLAAAAPAAACLDVLVAYTQHPASRLMMAPTDLEPELVRLERKHAALMRRLGTSIDRRDHRRYEAVVHRRAGRHARAAALYVHNAAAHGSPGDLLRALAAGLRLPPGAPRARRVTGPAWIGQTVDGGFESTRTS